MRLRTAKDRLKIEHSIIDGVRGILEELLKATPASRSVIPGVIRPVRGARPPEFQADRADAERMEGDRTERRRTAGVVHQHPPHEGTSGGGAGQSGGSGELGDRK